MFPDNTKDSVYSDEKRFVFMLTLCYFETSPVALRNNCYSFRDKLMVLEYENLEVLINPFNY